jgi:uncharacterized alpha-E superfamily protein
MSRARENARQVREVISPEMWQELNRQYWLLRDAMGGDVNDGTISQALTSIVSSSFLWDGVTDATMIRGEGWLFLKLGKFVERADGIARMVATRVGGGERASAAASGHNVEWLTLLKSLDAHDAYRKANPKRVERRAVLEFLLFEADFPRSLRHSTNTAADLARRLLRLHPESGRRVERNFGRVAARVEYADLEVLENSGATGFLSDVGREMNNASLELQKTFFLC